MMSLLVALEIISMSVMIAAGVYGLYIMYREEDN